MRVLSDRWMAVTLILLLPASRWPLPPLPPLAGHLHVAPPPPGSRPVIYTLYARAPVLTHRYTRTSRVFILRGAQSGPAPGDQARKQPVSRLNPGVSFPLRPSSHSEPPLSLIGSRPRRNTLFLQFQSTLFAFVEVTTCVGGLF